MIRVPHTVFVDDSGTDPVARIVVAAYCVSSVKNWKAFEREWWKIARESGFKHFHMTEFAGCKMGSWCRDCNKGKTDASDHPWREWTHEKRERVLKRLARTISRYAQHGAGIAITKEDYERTVLRSDLAQLAPEAAGRRHFTFAMQTCGGHLSKWRAEKKITNPLKFVFDLSDEKQKDENVRHFFATNDGKPQIEDGVERWFVPAGISYESRKTMVQLLSADMLAWVSAKIRAAQVFKGRLHPDAFTIAEIFLEGQKLGMGSVAGENLEEWARGEIALRTAGGSKNRE
jgi:hypothetical protein